MSNYEVVPSPNYAAYVNPGFGAALGQMLQGLPDQYMKGTQQKRELELQKPILDPKTGQPSMDPNVVAKELMLRGGAQYSANLLPFLQKQPIFDQILRENQDQGQGTPSSPSGPSNVSRAPLPPIQPQLSSAGADNKGYQTIN